MMTHKHFLLIIVLVIGILVLGNCTPKSKPPKSNPGTPALQTDEKSVDTVNPQTVEGEEPADPEEEPEKVLEDAEDAYQDALAAWEKADIETALAALDEAYRLILQLKLSQDSPLNREKDNLRLSIARRIQEIYASHLIAVDENHRFIPLVENKYVDAEIKLFQTREKEYFREAYRRSGRYRDMMREEMKKAGLPEELSWIPIIESGFNVRAYSRARALGLWQFISSTGYRFGLKKDRWVDERMDPEKATRAAVQYLKELHSFFGDWTTVLAAYNCGEFRVQRVIRAQRINYLDNFWDLFTMLPRETARFVPRFIATLMIIKNPEKYGFELPEPDPPVKYETVSVYRPIKLSALSSRLGLEDNALALLNPELRHRATPEKGYLLRVPEGYGNRALAEMDALSRWIPPEATYVIHYVRRGDTVSGIARRYRTSVSAIARLNRLRRNYLIRPGQRLKVPGRRGSIRTSRRTSRSPGSFKLANDNGNLVYKVRRGDSLYLIAAAFDTTVKEIKEFNRLGSNFLRVGQKLVIQRGTSSTGSSPPGDGSVYTVKAGDTPYTIAQKFGMKLKVLLRLNGLTSRSRIYPGQRLRILPRKDS